MKRRTNMRMTLFTAFLFLSGLMLAPGSSVEASGSRIILNRGTFEEATEEWDVMLDRLETAIGNGRGENVNFSAGNHFTVPEDILKKLAGKNATLALHTTNGVTFSISGRDVRKTDEPVQIDVSYEPMVSEEALGQISGYPVVKHFSMEEKTYPCVVNVHMALGEENFGNLAVLYSYDESGECLRLEESFRITKDGHAIFGLKRGDVYVAMMVRGYRVAAGDTLSHIAVKHGLSLEALKAANPQIHNTDLIQVGQMVNIPNR